MKFYVGISEPSWAHRFDRCFISINRLIRRKSDFEVNDWILDSGAFTQVNKGYGMGIDFCHQDNGYSISTRRYAELIARWSSCGNLVAACAQDFMCEDFMFEHAINPETGEPKTLEERWAMDDMTRGASIPEHQEMTVSRYLNLRHQVREIGCETPIMPVIQGYEIEDYLACIDLYESWHALPEGSYVGIGSVCKRNTNAHTVEGLLEALRDRRPDLRMHGFGLKVTALKSPAVRQILESSDSMAWSYAARKQGRNQNCWTEAAKYVDRVQELIDEDEEGAYSACKVCKKEIENKIQEI